MRKVIVAGIVMLLGVGILMSLVSRDVEHASEKMLYRAGKKLEQIQKNPDVIPPKLARSVETDLKRIIKLFPQAPAAKGAYMMLTDLYVIDKKTDRALATLDEMIKRYGDDKAFLTSAHLKRGDLLGASGKKEEAMQEYLLLRDKFTDTPIGLQMPLYIAQVFRVYGNTERAQQEFVNSVAYYDQLSRENRGTFLGYMALNYKMQAYLSVGQYEDAGNVIDAVLAEYPSQMTFYQQLANIEMIYERILNDVPKAVSLYKMIRSSSKDEKLTGLLATRIGQLEKQTEGVDVQK